MTGTPIAPEDWRLLRLLSFYRLTLGTVLLLMHITGYVPGTLAGLRAEWFRWTCLAYAAGALVLLWNLKIQKPGIATQAHVGFTVDLLAVAAMVYASGGVDGGLGTMLLIPTVACSLVLAPRMAMMQAALGTIGMLAEEVFRQYGSPMEPHGFTSTGVLGLILFGTSMAASTVAVRARKSEALAQRMGSEFDNLSRLNEIILESMQTGVVVLDGKLRIGNLNAAASGLLRLTPDAVVGRPLELESSALAEHLQDWLMTGEQDESPFSLGPGMAEVVARVSRLGDTDRAPIMVLLDDASRVREQAQQIKLAALGRLSASIAHEIRNPLSAISHAGQLLYEATDISPENRRLLSMIHRHSDRIDKIVGDVMAMSRREPAQPMSIPLAPWMEDTITLYLEAHRHESRSFDSIEIPPAVRVRFDPRHLQQLMFNLWDNAFRHGAREGVPVKVRILADIERSGRPWLEVADNGPGIPKDLVEHVFEPFFTTAHGGTGLGLYLAREMCEFNQARMSYQQRPVGACFRISFTPGSPT